ncbi:MAG: TPM domain-containing protein, partial [Candidatus Electrothrix sp. EH2]|nr:TPM domain-containing protein [Candidatus Electrothrix sp. EH2]
KGGIGQKGKDNGVLLLVAKKERKVRLEVGYGLEGVLTDLLAGRIIDDVITPRFKSGQFDQGVEAGVKAVIQATRGEFKADQTSSRRSGRREESPLLSYLFFGGSFISFLGKASRKWGMLAGAIILPVIFLLASSLSWLMLLVLIPIGALAGLVLSFIDFFSGGSGSSGGSSSSSGGGFGGFSGGGSDSFSGGDGGSFGGGGASGDW